MNAKAQDLTDFFGGGGGGSAGRSLPSLLRRARRRQQDDDQAPAPRGRGSGGAQRRSASRRRVRRRHRLHHQQGRPHPHEQPRRRRRDEDRGALYGDEDDVSYPAKVVGTDPLTDSALIQLIDKPKHPLPEAKFGDSSQMARGRLGDGDRQPVQLRAHRHRRRHQRDERAVPGHRRPLERHAADRRRDQPGQLRRPAAERARRGDRHQHGDHHQRAQPRGTSASASRCRSTPCAICCRSCAAARSSAAASASRCRRFRAKAIEDFGLKIAQRRDRRERRPGRRGGEGRHPAGRRHRRSTTAGR